MAKLLDVFLDMHRNPTTAILHIVGIAIAICGIWQHSWSLIILAIIVLVVGHLFPVKKAEEAEVKAKKKRK